MKKTIIYVGVALLVFSQATFAKQTENISSSVITSVDYEGRTPLVVAIMKGDFDTVKKFVEYGCDVNELSNGLTPLMIAARYNKVEIVSYLLQNGARPETKDDRGNTALKYAQLSKASEVIAVLKNAKPA